MPDRWVRHPDRKQLWPVCLVDASTSTLTWHLIKTAITHRERNSAAVDINSGKNGKVKRLCKTEELQCQFYAWASSWHGATITHKPLLTPNTQSFTNILRLHADTLTDSLSLFFWLARSLTHTLRSSMVGSDTKLMPCHTGCQQISQWITPQPLDVHRAKGHKHGREME